MSGERDEVGDAIVHVHEYAGGDAVALEYWARMLAFEVVRLRDVAGAARLVVYEDGPGHLSRLVKAVWALDGRKSSLLGDPPPGVPQPTGETAPPHCD